MHGLTLFGQDLRFAFRSLMRAKGLATTVVLTLALGIGANAAIFSLVRGVLLRPLANDDESRLIYVKQSAKGIGMDEIAWSVPEIQDFKNSIHSLSEFGDFSAIPMTMVGLGEPREIQSAVVGGNYFQTVGLHPVLGRLIGPQDDGPKAAGVVVLTYPFWSSALKKDPNVIGRQVRLDSFDSRTATVIGVLEPSLPYPTDTAIIANVVMSAHHLDATMVTGRVHRMTELFGRLAPGVTLDQARAELQSVYATMKKDHHEAYPTNANFQIDARLFRDQVTSDARPILLVLLGASALVFIIACSNAANLILARTVRREGELTIRAALGASSSALRRTLLAESLVLCVAGAAFGVMIARPLLDVLARYASKFSVRALNLTVDSSVLWVGAGLAIIAAVLLAYVPRLPSANVSQSNGLASGSVRITGSTNRRLRAFAVVQIAASFMLLAGASMLLKTLVSMMTAQTGMDTRHVLAINVPVIKHQKTDQQVVDFYKETIRRVDSLPGVTKTAYGMSAPWRDGNNDGPGLQFSADGHASSIENDPHAHFRVISPGFFAALGVPILAGRDFNDLDTQSKEPIAIVSETVAKRMFPGQDAINRHVYWTDPVLAFIPGFKKEPLRIIGVTADIDDENLPPRPTLTIYSTFNHGPMFGGRLFIHTSVNPYSLVTAATRIIRGMSPEQPVEKAATLEDIRAEVLTPDRLNTVVFGIFAAVALTIALVGVAGVLAFSVSARTREFGIRLALGSPPKHLLAGVIREGVIMAVVGVVAGGLGGYALARFAEHYFPDLVLPSAFPIVGSVLVLLAAAVVASALPAARAARVDVMQALRSD
ncbi:MAG TPA: ADOP family duplicated permease [Candidatus Acidoferrum sp.]|jgi:predicted permease|nr:ADOP family duplicated permease [Candidatus Acidoferrum sp.]